MLSEKIEQTNFDRTKSFLLTAFVNGFFYLPQDKISKSVVCKKELAVFRPYPRRLESLAICRCNKTLRSVHFGVVVGELTNCKCGRLVRNEIR